MKDKMPFYSKLAHVLVGLIALVYIAVVGQSVLAPLLLAFLFSFLLLPFVGFLEKRLKFPRLLSSLAAMAALLIGFSTLAILLGSQVTSLANDWPAFQAQLLSAFNNMQDWIERTFHMQLKDQLSFLSEGALKILGTGTSIIGVTLMSVSSLFIFLVLTFLYIFFILLHRRLLLRFIVAVFPKKNSAVVYEVVSQVEFIVKRYVFGIFIQMCIVTLLTFIAFSLIGIKYSLLLGIITGIFNVIPYLGILTAFLLAALITFATSSLTEVFLLAIALIVIHAIDGNYVMPKIVGSKVRINTLVALLGLVIGEMIWGITGMLFSIPVLAILKVIFDRVEGLKPWGMLLGDEDVGSPQKPAILEVIEDENRLEKKQPGDIA